MLVGLPVEAAIFNSFGKPTAQMVLHFQIRLGIGKLLVSLF
ncbi:hypothetical protein GGE12_006832 [Rhizobium mongolense]|uniref:Uncharacterized protein n=1 Tax=Rhizobium mongolense TaxID=57676 RepID=A0A7W6WIM0_9HYPH|nr:hypothetical protein [Rhizobium mongolense]